MPGDDSHCGSNAFETAAATRFQNEPLSIIRAEHCPAAGARHHGVARALYREAELDELRSLVLKVRATSPDSVLANMADAKIGRATPLRGGDL